MNSLQTQIEFDNTTFAINFPNEGQLRRIELLKQSLAGGMYLELIQANTTLGSRALDSIDMEATFSVLVPKLTERLPKPISELDAFIVKKLIKQYKKFTEWYNPLLKDLLADEDDEKEMVEKK